MGKLIFNEEEGDGEGYEEIMDTTTEEQDETNLSELRAQALGDATVRIKEMAENDQHAALNIIIQNEYELNALFDQPNHEIKTLGVVLSVFFNDAPIGTFEMAKQGILSSPVRIISSLQSFSAQSLSKEQYLRLCGFFVNGFSLFPEFTLSKLSNFGKLAEALYEWCDASFTLANLIYDD